MQKRNRIIKIIGLFLVIGAILLLFNFVYNKHIDRQKTNNIIKELFNEQIDIPQVEIISEYVETDSTEHESIKEQYVVQSEYLGYIEISSSGIKRLIKYGTSESILNKGFVGMLTNSANLDDEFGNIILAGHSISNVFQNLHYINIGDSIKIVSHSDTYLYKIIGKYTIADNDLSYFQNVKDKKILTLVTCKNNNKQRLIIVAELCK